VSKLPRNKYPEKTVEKILDASLQLFLEKGYENTTIQDIADHLDGLSRGAVNHHFKSKEEIINAVMDRIYNQNVSFSHIRHNKDLNGLQKIQRIYIESMQFNEANDINDAASILLKNPKFILKELEQSSKVYAPIIREFIEEGMQDGSITARYPKQLSEIVMLLSNFWLIPKIYPVTKEEFMDKVNCIKMVLDGAGLPIIDAQVMAAFQRASCSILK